MELRRQSEQTIDRHTIDDVLYSGFDASAVESATGLTMWSHCSLAR